jgi:hypothetical protein
MAATLLLYGSVSGLIDNRRLVVGTLNTPFSFSVKGQKDETTVSIANAANAAVYANALGQLNTIAIECDYNTRVVLTDTANSSFSLALRGTGKAGKYGHPLVLTKCNTINSATTINSVVVHNKSGSAAKVHFLGVK